MCNLSNFILSTLALISIGNIGYNSYIISEKKNDFTCGNLNYGFISGLSAFSLLLLSIILNYKTRGFKPLLLIGSLGILGTLGYNIYLYKTSSNTCSQHYNIHDTNFWYYGGYLIVHIFTSVLILLYYLLQLIYKRTNYYNKYYNYEDRL